MLVILRCRALGARAVWSVMWQAAHPVAGCHSRAGGRQSQRGGQHRDHDENALRTAHQLQGNTFSKAFI
jgi:hypothetical protein